LNKRAHPARNHGIEVHRSYRVKDGQTWTALRPPLQLKRGDVVEVTLRVVAPATRYFVALNDPIPGGFEPINTDLATSAQTDTAQVAPPNRSAPRDSHYFYHRELRHHAARFFADELPQGEHYIRYTAQVIAAGRFWVGAAHAEEMYEPDVFGASATAELVVDEAIGK
jgi:uncharacterized protein YfaS (alpha-2-macroglobulin family)